MLVISGFIQRYALACELIQYSNYDEIAPNIFVSDRFNVAQKELYALPLSKEKCELMRALALCCQLPNGWSQLLQRS